MLIKLTFTDTLTKDYSARGLYTPVAITSFSVLLFWDDRGIWFAFSQNRYHKNLVNFIICNALPGLINIMVTWSVNLCKCSWLYNFGDVWNLECGSRFIWQFRIIHVAFYWIFFFLVSNYYHTFISQKAYASNSHYYSLIMFFKRTTHCYQFFKIPLVSLVAIGRISSWFLLVRSCLIISF